MMKLYNQTMKSIKSIFSLAYKCGMTAINIAEATTQFINNLNVELPADLFGDYKFLFALVKRNFFT